MKIVNLNEVLKILHKYGKYIFISDEKRYTDMIDEIANIKGITIIDENIEESEDK